MDNFRTTLKYLRQKYGYTQLELAKQLGVSKSTISLYELGKRKPNISFLIKTADFFNVDINYLTAREDNEITEISNEIMNNKDLKRLFDVAKNLSSRDLSIFIETINLITRKDLSN